MFKLPEYQMPSFDEGSLKDAPAVTTTPAPKDGIAPAGYHAMSIFPEYFKHGDEWIIA